MWVVRWTARLNLKRFVSGCAAMQQSELEEELEVDELEPLSPAFFVGMLS